MRVEDLPDRNVGDYEWTLRMHGPMSPGKLARRLGVKLARCRRSLSILEGLESVECFPDGRYDIKDPITRDGGRFP
jgi:DNA-binding IclR family transcriptional regulator